MNKLYRIENRSRKRRMHWRTAKTLNETKGISDFFKLNTDNEHIYIVERVLEYKIVKGKRMAWIKWKGYPESESTWEPEDAIFEMSKISQLSFAKKNAVHGIDDASRMYSGDRCIESIGYYADSTAFSNEKSATLEYQSDLKLFRFETKEKTEDDSRAPTVSVDCLLRSSAKQTAVVEEPVAATLMELAVKLELVEKVPTFHSIDQWSAGEVREYLSFNGYAIEASQLAEEEIDGMALTCISSPFMLEQCGVPAERAGQLFGIIQRMQAMTSNTYDFVS